MRTSQMVIDDMLQNSKLANSKRLSQEDLELLIKEYQDSVFRTLLNNGYVKISEDIEICLVKLKDRRYVLRGNSYMNHRKYKLKMVTSRSVYDKIEDSYDLFV